MTVYTQIRIFFHSLNVMYHEDLVREQAVQFILAAVQTQIASQNALKKIDST